MAGKIDSRMDVTVPTDYHTNPRQLLDILIYVVRKTRKAISRQIANGHFAYNKLSVVRNRPP